MEAGEATNFTVTFTEMGDSTKLGSAQLFIPNSLIVDDSQKPTVPEGWDSKWDNPGDTSTFGIILSMWALLESNYLSQGESVSATFTATASAEQTHHFDTKAWTDASGGEGTESDPHTGVGETTNNYYGYDSNNDTYTNAYSQPKVNVWVDGGSGYAEGNSSNGSLTRVADLDNVHAARDHDGDLIAGLENVHENLNWHYVQTEDIDLNGNGNWDPIGSEDDPFTGAFDGNGKTINDLKYNDTYGWDIGLFGHTAESAVINNASLTNVDITAGGQVGALVGTNLGRIINSSAAGAIQLSEENGQPWAVGGLVGLNAGGVITGSFADVNIIVGSSESRVLNVSSIGGLVGANGYNNPQGNDTDLIGGSIGGSHATGSIDIYATGDVEYVGGLVGFNREADITSSHSTGSITIDTTTGKVEYVGGLIGGNGNFSSDGDFLGGDISNSHYETGTISVSAGGQALYVAGLAGYSKNGHITGSHVGSATNPVMITVKSDDDLWGVGGLAGEFENGVIANSDAYVQITVEGVRTDVVNAKSYEGIGGLIGSVYYTEINNSSAEGSIDVGRFGNQVGFATHIGGLAGLMADGNINNSLTNVTIKIFVSNHSGDYKAERIGGLIGHNERSNITDSNAKGDIQIDSSDGDIEYIGGLIGFNEEADVSNCYATGDLTITAFSGAVNYIGGLVGVNGDGNLKLGGNITNSYYETGTLEIKALSDQVSHVGGLVGYSSGGNITGSYAGNASSAVEFNLYASGGMWDIGGLIGGFDHGSITVSDAFAKINVAGGTSSDYQEIGGLIGSGDDAEISNSSANGTITVGTDSNRVGSAGDIGGLAGSITYVDLDGCTANVAIVIHAVSGATEMIGGLVGYSSDGDITGSSAYGDITINSLGKVEQVGGLIGTNGDPLSDSYKGGSVLDSHASGDISIDAIGNVKHVGGLVGFNREADITDSSASGSISINAEGDVEDIGGLVGHNSRGTVTACWSDSNITATSTDNFDIDTVGGLVGFNQLATISDSKAFSSIDLKGEDIGEVGGLVGDNANGEIRNSYAQGEIKIEANDVIDSIGGLLGFNSGSNGTVEDCYAVVEIDIISGTVLYEDPYPVGGLVGYDDFGVVTNSFYLDRGTYNNGFGTPKSDAEMKTLALYADANWLILPYADFDPANPQAATWYIKEGEDYPILWWEHSRYGESTGPGFTFRPGFNLGAINAGFFLQPPFLMTGELSAFERIMALIEPTATAGFVQNGSALELDNARSRFEAALQLYEENLELLTDQERSIIQTYFALAEMAILALEARLLSEAGEAYNLAALEQAYTKARELYALNMHLLSGDQITAVETLFSTAEALISLLSSP